MFIMHKIEEPYRSETSERFQLPYFVFMTFSEQWVALYAGNGVLSSGGTSTSHCASKECTEVKIPHTFDTVYTLHANAKLNTMTWYAIRLIVIVFSPAVMCV